MCPQFFNKVERMQFEGVFPAITTPFYPDGRVYFRKLEQNIARYAATPVAGLVVLGSTGEVVMLSGEEQRDVLRACSEARPEGTTLLAGTGAESVRETVRMCECAAELGYHAVVVRTPHYYRNQLTPAAMLTYFRAVADRSPLPVILYSVPQMTGYDLPVELIVELASHPNVAGIKESSGSIDKVKSIVEKTRRCGCEQKVAAGDGEGFQVLVGSAQKLYLSLQADATGAVLAFADVAPVSCAAIHDAWKSGDSERAAEIQQRVTAAAARIAGEFGIPGIKYAMDFNGYYGGPPRLPLLPVDVSARTEIETLLSNLRQ